MIGSRCDQIAVHGPVVIFAKGDSIRGVVVSKLAPWKQVCGVDKGHIVSAGKADPKTTGGALVIVDFEDCSPEGRGPAIFDPFLRYLSGWRSDRRRFSQIEELGRRPREVAGDECFTHFSPRLRNRDEDIKAVDESGENPAKVGRSDLPPNGSGPIALQREPEPVAGQISERKVGIVLVVQLPDDVESRGKPIPEFLTPRNVVWSGQSFVNQIERCQKEQWLVRSLVRRAVSLRGRCADAERIKIGDGFLYGHVRGDGFVIGMAGGKSSKNRVCKASVEIKRN